MCSIVGGHHDSDRMVVLMMVIIANQLSKYVEDNKLFHDNQNGFRTGLSTEYATIELTYRIISNMDRNEIPFSIFV